MIPVVVDAGVWSPLFDPSRIILDSRQQAVTTAQRRVQMDARQIVFQAVDVNYRYKTSKKQNVKTNNEVYSHIASEYPKPRNPIP